MAPCATPNDTLVSFAIATYQRGGAASVAFALRGGIAPQSADCSRGQGRCQNESEIKQADVRDLRVLRHLRSSITAA
jgi:hypothetical protein